MKIIFQIDARYRLVQQHEQLANGKSHWRLYRDGEYISVTKGRISFGKALTWAMDYIAKEK